LRGAVTGFTKFAAYKCLFQECVKEVVKFVYTGSDSFKLFDGIHFSHDGILVKNTVKKSEYQWIYLNGERFINKKTTVFTVVFLLF
jgi:hypothetical protein